MRPTDDQAWVTPRPRARSAAPGRGRVGAHRAAPRERRLAAGLLSATVPGAGHLLTPRRRRGAALLALVALVLAGATGGAATVLADGPGAMLGLLARREALTALAAANVGVAVVRLAAGIDAWRAGGDRAPSPAQAAGLGVGLLVLIGVPHAAAGVALHDLGRVVDAVTVPATVEAADEVVADVSHRDPSARAEASPEEGGRGDEPGEGPETGDDGAETAEGLDARPSELRAPAVPDPRSSMIAGSGQEPPERLHVLVLGSDAGPERSGTRVDAALLAALDPESGAVRVVSVPRGLGDLPMPEGILAERLGDPYSGSIMELHRDAEADDALAEAFGDPGREALAGAVSALLDQPVHHVATVDLGGFVELVDALDGVEVDVDRRIDVELSPAREGDDWRRFEIPAGTQRLDGQEALAYVRSREGTDDFDRMRRQRCLAGSLVTDTGGVDLVRALPDLADVIVDRVSTDVPVDDLPRLARLAHAADLDGLGSLGLEPPQHTTGRNAEGWLRPDLDAVRDDVATLLDGAAEPGEAGVEDLDAACG